TLSGGRESRRTIAGNVVVHHCKDQGAACNGGGGSALLGETTGRPLGSAADGCDNQEHSQGHCAASDWELWGSLHHSADLHGMRCSHRFCSSNEYSILCATNLE